MAERATGAREGRVRRALRSPRRRPVPGGSLLPWLVLYMALFLLRPWEVLVPGLQVVPVEKIVGIAVVLRVLVGPGREISFPRPTLGLLAFCLSLVVATGLSVEPARSWVVLETTLKAALFALCVSFALLRARDLSAWLRAWVYLAGIYQAKALWEYFLHGRGVYRMGIWRLVGIEDTFGDPNTFAAKTVLVLPFLLVLLTRKEGRARWLLHHFLLAQAVLVVILTGSRAGLLGLVALGLLAPWTMRDTRRLVRRLAIVAVPLVLLWLPQQLVQRYETLVHPEINRAAWESARGREAGFWKGLYLFRRFPLSGIGPGCFVVSREHVGPIPGEVPGLQPHNLPGQLLGETGLVGLAGFLALLLALFSSWGSVRAAMRARATAGSRAPPPEFRSWTDALGTSLLLMLLFGIPGHNLYEYNWAWLAAGFAAACRIARASCAGEAVRPPRRAVPAGRKR